MDKAVKNKNTFKVLTALCLCAAAASLVYICSYAYKYFAHRDMNAGIASLYSELAYETYGVSPYDKKPLSFMAGPDTNSDGDLNSALNLQDVSSPGGPAVPAVSDGDLLLMAETEGRKRFGNFLEINGDFIGMLIIDGLGMKLPFVQTSDNEKYLDIDFEGSKSSYGTVFLSCFNNSRLTDKNNVLFGHHMRNNEMFTPIMKYKDIKTLESAPVIELDSLTGRSRWVVFAAYTCEPDYGYIDTSLKGAAFSGLLEEITSRSIFHTNLDVNEDDQIITLSTCTYDFQDARFAVHARRLRPGEGVPAVEAVKNPNPKPYNVPMQKNISEIAASNTAVMRNSSMQRNYYYQTAQDGIQWYVGNNSSVQGAYSCYVSDGAPAPYLSALYIPDTRKTLLALDSFNGKKGVYLMSSGTPSGPFALPVKASVTPDGIDARFPLLALYEADGEDTLWLLYTVREDETEKIFRAVISAAGWFGEPECILEVPSGTNVRPAGMVFAQDEPPLFLWHEISSKSLFARYIGTDAPPVPLSYSGDADRITVFGKTDNGELRIMSEKNGRLRPGTFDISAIPPPPQPEPEIPAEAEPETVPEEITAEPETASSPEEILSETAAVPGQDEI